MQCDNTVICCAWHEMRYGYGWLVVHWHENIMLEITCGYSVRTWMWYELDVIP